MRLAAYAGTSTVLASGVILRAFHQRANFYSACVYLAQSNACLMILTNLVLLGVCLAMLTLQRLLYGPLRPIEIEQLYEKAWFAVTETCLAMTIFREEVGGWFLVMFVALLVGKVWGWIGEGRVDVLEQQPPANPRLFHARLSFSLLLSLVFDGMILRYSIESVLRIGRPNMMVMFAFEFAVLSIASSSTAARYAISLTETYVTKRQAESRREERRAALRAANEEARRQALRDGNVPPPLDEAALHEIDDLDIDAPGWEGKGRWVFYLDLVTDFLKLIVYLSFFFILLTFYGLPIHIMRDVFLTLRSFIKRINDFLRYRRATRDMNERYPDASAEEVTREEVCIICREEMEAWTVPAQHAGGAAVEAAAGQQHARPPHIDERSRPKKLPCGHILHFGCLRSWLERQQNCPTCRRPVMTTRRSGFGRSPPAAALERHEGPGARPAMDPARLAAQADAIQQHQQLQQQRLQRQQPQQQPQQQQPNRGRIFNFGPFRIGFGVGQGDLFQDLAHRMNDNQQQGNQLPAQGQGNNAGGLRQIGFGFGVGRQAAVPALTHTQQHLNTLQGVAAHHLPINAQLQRLEQQINDEFSTLRASREQLRLITALHTELHRLRQQTQGEGGSRISRSNSHHPMQTRHLLSNVPPTNALQQGVTVTQTHAADPRRHPAMQMGHPDLPRDVHLPPGWSLLPLQRMDHPPGMPLPPALSQPLTQNGDAAVGPSAPAVNPDLAFPGHHHHTSRFPTPVQPEVAQPTEAGPVSSLPTYAADANRRPGVNDEPLPAIARWDQDIMEQMVRQPSTRASTSTSQFSSNPSAAPPMVGRSYTYTHTPPQSSESVQASEGVSTAPHGPQPVSSAFAGQSGVPEDDAASTGEPPSPPKWGTESRSHPDPPPGSLNYDGIPHQPPPPGTLTSEGIPSGAIPQPSRRRMDDSLPSGAAGTSLPSQVLFSSGQESTAPSTPPAGLLSQPEMPSPPRKSTIAKGKARAVTVEDEVDEADA